MENIFFTNSIIKIHNINYPMKIFILITILSISFSTFSQKAIDIEKISIQFKEVELKDALVALESKISFRIAFNSSSKGMKDIITKNYEARTIEAILIDLLEGRDLKYKFVGKVITVYTPTNEAFFEIKGINSNGNFNISGSISDSETGEALIGANIFDKASLKGTSTNGYGFYSLEVKGGLKTLVVSYSGFDSYEWTVVIDRDMIKDVSLLPNSFELETVVITSEELQMKSSEISTIKFSQVQVASIPAILGEPDMQQAILSTAGVSSIGEGTTGFNVRGGKTDHNLILVDEAPLYNTAHLFGFISVINNEAVKDMKFYKAGIPAKYGGRTSSVIDIRLREGNNKVFAGSASLNPISSKIGLEIPIIKDKLNVYFSGRRSFLDLFMKIPDDPLEEGQVINFHDATLKINYNINRNNRVFLSGYSGEDFLDQQYESDGRSIKDGFGWGDRLATLRWNHIFSQKIFSNITLVTGNYTFDYGSSYDDSSGEPTIGNSGVKTLEGKFDLSFFLSPKLDLHVGSGVKNNIFTPLHQRSAKFSHLPDPEDYGLEYFNYVDVDINPIEKLKIRAGLRFAGIWTYGPGFILKYDTILPPSELTVVDVERVAANQTIAHYNNPEPRLAISYQLNDKHTLKAAFDRMVQYVHLLSSSNAIVPFDSWSPSNYHLRPTISDQLTIGYAYNKEKWSLSIDAFDKQMKNFLEFKENAQLLLQQNVEVTLVPAELNSFGIEFTLGRIGDKFKWSTNYTFSRSFVKTFSQWKSILINNGDSFSSNYDRPHNLNLLITLSLSDRVKLNSKFMYQSGRPITLPEGRINNLIIYSDRNSYRLPPNHRLDVSFSIQERISDRKIKGEWVFSILNLYANKNTYSYFISKDLDRINAPYTLKKLSILGTMIPSFSYNIKF
jgi:hypothetical protein